ncbi:MAG: hypothetical protein Q9160_007970 [Pyrenula sp. 1 TL-2023]
MLLLAGFILAFLHILNVTLALDSEPEQFPASSYFKKKRDDPAVTLTMSDPFASPLATSTIQNASIPEGSEILVQNTTDGTITLYFGDQLRSVINHTIQENCTDLYNAACHEALQQDIRVNQTDAQHNTKDLAISPNPAKKRQIDEEDFLKQQYVTSAAGSLVIASFVAPELVPILAAVYICSYFLFFKSSTGPKNIPKALQIPKTSADLLKGSNATAIRLAGKDQKPLIVEEQCPYDLGACSNHEIPVSSEKICPEALCIQAEGNGDYTLHLDPSLAKNLTTLLDTNQSMANSTSEHPPKKTVKRQAGGLVVLPVNIPTNQRPRIIEGTRVITEAFNRGGPAQNLMRFRELAPHNARVAARPVPQYQVSLFGPGEFGQNAVSLSRDPLTKSLTSLLRFSQDWITQAFVVVDIAENVIAGNRAPDEADAEGWRILREFIFVIVTTWAMMPSTDLVRITVGKDFQDQGPQCFCPEKGLLRCEEKGCLSSRTGRKTNNEICPPDAQFPNYRGCACTDCEDVEYMPLCDNCGGALAPRSKLEERDRLGSDGNLLPRIAPDPNHPGNQTCKGVSLSIDRREPTD